MPNKLPQYYKESGNATTLNITLSILCGLFLIGFLSMLYAMFVAYIPIVYFNILLTLGFGIAISFVSRLFNRIFKIRNRKKTLIITIILALFGAYFQWIWYLMYISSEQFQVFENISSFFNLLVHPNWVIESIIEINQVGVWSIFGLPTFNGVFLWVIWISEIIIIVYMAYHNYANFETIPFSEQENQWYKKEYIDAEFEYIAYKQKFIDEFQISPYETIKKLAKGNGLRHSRVSIYKTKTESKYLFAINNVIVTQQGKGKEDIKVVLNPCFINKLSINKIKNDYRIKKSSHFEF